MVASLLVGLETSSRTSPHVPAPAVSFVLVSPGSPDSPVSSSAQDSENPGPIGQPSSKQCLPI